MTLVTALYSTPLSLLWDMQFCSASHRCARESVPGSLGDCILIQNVTVRLAFWGCICRVLTIKSRFCVSLLGLAWWEEAALPDLIKTVVQACLSGLLCACALSEKPTQCISPPLKTSNIAWLPVAASQGCSAEGGKGTEIMKGRNGLTELTQHILLAKNHPWFQSFRVLITLICILKSRLHVLGSKTHLNSTTRYGLTAGVPRWGSLAFIIQQVRLNSQMVLSAL